MADLLDQLVEWLRIPSISTGGGEPADLRRAAEWAAEHVERAGGSAELVQIGDGNPLAIGDLRANRRDAPTILIYGHYDVQSVGDLSAWTLAAVRARDPRRPRSTRAAPPTTRATSGRSCTPPAGSRARASCRSTCASSSRARRRPGRRASPSGCAPTSAAPTRRSCSTPAWSTRRRPAITLGLRGMAMAQIEVRTGRPRPALGHVRRQRAQRAARPAPHARPGRPRPRRDAPRRAARGRPAARRGRADLVGAPAARRRRCSSEVGGREAYPGAAAEYYERNGADASLEVNEIVGGEPRTLVPAVARAHGVDPARARPARDRDRPGARAPAARRGAAPTPT